MTVSRFVRAVVLCEVKGHTVTCIPFEKKIWPNLIWVVLFDFGKS